MRTAEEAEARVAFQQKDGVVSSQYVPRGQGDKGQSVSPTSTLLHSQQGTPRIGQHDGHVDWHPPAIPRAYETPLGTFTRDCLGRGVDQGEKGGRSKV